MDLRILGPEGTKQHVELAKDAVRLGRSPDNELAYPDDPWLSRYHLVFELVHKQWYVKDRASRNGTVVNAQALRQPHKLRAGDRIYAGHLTIEVNDRARQPDIVSFVAHSEEPASNTIVTSLDQVLKDTATAAKQPNSSSLGNSRVVHALIRAGQELAGRQSLDELFPLILDLALSAMEAQRGVILTLENGDLVVRASKGHEFTISTAVRDRVLGEKSSLIISDAQADDIFRNQKSILAQRVRSMIAVPLQTGSRVIGLIYVDNGSFVRPFQHEDLELLTVMANVAAIRIEHARLVEVEQQERMMALELAQASELQRSLLPSQAPQIENYDLAGFNLPCRTVGGDYFDFVQHPDGRMGLVVGDVSGKGMPAALLMSSLQARVQMLVATQPDPASAVSILNRNLAERFPEGRFITLFYALLDFGTGRICYCNAGHNYPLIIRSEGTVEELPGSDMVLGIRSGSTYVLRESYLRPGDTLALYSDGVTEARNIEDEEFGGDGLSKFLARSRFQSCADTIAALANHVREWSGTTQFHDDFTVVLVKRLPIAHSTDSASITLSSL